MKLRSRFLFLALLSALGVGAAVAEEPQPQQGSMMGYWPEGMMARMGWGMMGDYGPMTEGRLAYMKAELGITDAQKTEWDSYASALKSRVTTMQGMHTAMIEAMKSGNAIQRLDARINAMESMVESLKAERPAIDALYKTLSDDQRKKADLLLGMGCCMM